MHLMNGPNKLVLNKTRLKRLANDKHSSLLGPFVRYSQHQNFFELMNGANKLEYYITNDWKGLPGTNTLAYYDNL